MLYPLDSSKPFTQQKYTGHNRWHPDIPPNVTVRTDTRLPGAFGYSPEQAYMILGAAPVEGRPFGVGDIPNSCSTVYIRTAIFNLDGRPFVSGPTRIDPGMGVPRASL